MNKHYGADEQAVLPRTPLPNVCVRLSRLAQVTLPSPALEHTGLSVPFRRRLSESARHTGVESSSLLGTTLERDAHCLLLTLTEALILLAASGNGFRTFGLQTGCFSDTSDGRMTSGTRHSRYQLPLSRQNHLFASHRHVNMS
ncbi:hypothetical protein Bbelb_264350 [Branchiostoma belcheri]|nr:hypothetical protein Bbelb_264350 [Branchiostoma belcheri]